MLRHRIKKLLFGPGLDLKDRSIFKHMSMIAFFAWIGLGADGLSSSCYGPEEVFRALGDHKFLAVLVGLGTVATIFIISASYRQIIELFPHGGGGYLVATELLSPSLGMISGCALIIDYALTVTLSVASGADAFFSLLPPHMLKFKVPFAVAVILILTMLNLRGAKESIKFLLPIFMTFIITHAIIIIYTIFTHSLQAPEVVSRISEDVKAGTAELGTAGLLILMLRAYSLGAGTYTGLEAVSNGLPLLKEPRIHTGKRTMTYMAVSLSVTVMGLMLAYVLYGLSFQEGKTLNATLLETMTSGWSSITAGSFIFIVLLSEAFLLFVAAQTGFLDGPRVMANMALDKWFPGKFTILSDRLVIQNGILYFAAASIILMIFFNGKVSHLVVLYSINVFITFVLSQSGMVKHWWQVRHTPAIKWKSKMFINALGLSLTSFILISVVLVKFTEGGWITLVVTTMLVSLAFATRRHYDKVNGQIKVLNTLMAHIEKNGLPVNSFNKTASDQHPTAVILLDGYNGLGLKTILTVLDTYENYFKNFLFLQIGVANANIFKRSHMLENMAKNLAKSNNKYIQLMQSAGFEAKGAWSIGTDMVHEIMELLPGIKRQYPKIVFFGGQLIFQKENIFTRQLHNYWIYSLQRKLMHADIHFMPIPVIIPADE